MGGGNTSKRARSSRFVWALVCASLIGCTGELGDEYQRLEPRSHPDDSSDPRKPLESRSELHGWPEPNAWSWDGSWSPSSSAFPLQALLDNEYHDGHLLNGNPTPVLPPGAWDWNDANNDLANWRNFETNLGVFEALRDADQQHFGWRLVGNEPLAVDYAGAAAYFEGSSGADIVELGPSGSVHSFAEGNLADGPDVFQFNSSYSLDFRTGSTASGHARDNDLVVAGCDENPDGSFDVLTTTVHTGPGSDWVFIRDLSRAAVDLGNGADGRTAALDGNDGDDLVVLRGNTHDFRVYGGYGHDTAVWYPDDNVQTTTWLGPNFFGAGGEGDALWGDPGEDRLVLAVPYDTRIVTQTPTPQGALLVRASDGGSIVDGPTQHDPYAAYCVECGTGPGGRKTMILEYHSASGHVFTGFFYVTAFEELQVGVGDGAQVYDLDDVAGTATPSSAAPAVPPSWPSARCE